MTHINFPPLTIEQKQRLLNSLRNPQLFQVQDCSVTHVLSPIERYAEIALKALLNDEEVLKYIKNDTSDVAHICGLAWEIAATMVEEGDRLFEKLRQADPPETPEPPPASMGDCY